MFIPGNIFDWINKKTEVKDLRKNSVYWKRHCGVNYKQSQDTNFPSFSNRVH